MSLSETGCLDTDSRKLTERGTQLAALILSLGPFALVSAVPTPLAPGGSMIPLYIDDPIYYHEVLPTYPTFGRPGGNAITHATPLRITPSASVSHGSTSRPSPKSLSPSCQHSCAGSDMAQTWLRWIHRAWLNQVTIFAKE